MAGKSPPPATPPAPLAGIAPARFAALLGVILATALAVTGAFALLPSSPWTRVRQVDGTIYANLIWARQRVFVDKTPINVAIIGDSRLKMGISGPILEQTLTRSLGRPIHVANFASLHEGRDLHYLLARDIILHHPELRVLVLSFTEIPARRSHPAFYLLADPVDLLTAPLADYDYFPNLLKLPYRQLSLFAAERVGHEAPLPAYPGSNPDTAEGPGPLVAGQGRDRIVPAEQLQQAAGQAHDQSPVLLPASMRRIEFAPEYAYLDRIAALARAHGVRIVMVYQPCFGYTDPAVYERYYGDYGAVLLLPQFITDSTIHFDVCHTNRTGSRVMTGQIAGFLTGQLR